MSKSYKKITAIVLSAAVIAISAVTARAAVNYIDSSSTGETPISDIVNTFDDTDTDFFCLDTDTNNPNDTDTDDTDTSTPNNTDTDDTDTSTPNNTDTDDTDTSIPDDTDTDNTEFSLGDVVKNGRIDSADALFILRASVDLEEYVNDSQQSACDINSDFKVSSLDSLIALRISVGLESIDTYEERREKPFLE